MWENAKITNNGRTLLSQWVSGTTLNVTKATIGTGVVSADSMAAMTQISGEVANAIIGGSMTVDDGTQFMVQMGAMDSATTIHQVGIWGKIGSGSEVLIAVYQDNTGVALPAKADIPDFAYTLYAIIAVSGGGSLNVTIDSTALVSRSVLDAAVEQIDAQKANANHTHALTSDSVTGVLPIAKGGTGSTSAAAARAALGLGNTNGPLPVANGGTGANSAAEARANLGITLGNLGVVYSLDTPPVIEGGIWLKPID